MPHPQCIGTIACLTCNAEIPVKKNDNGALNLSCGFCDLSAYAKAGTQAHRLASSRLKPLPGAAAPEVKDGRENEPAPIPKPTPATPAKKSALPWAK